jgi:hypothetical protein
LRGGGARLQKMGKRKLGPCAFHPLAMGHRVGIERPNKPAGVKQMGKSKMSDELRKMLRDVFVARASGTSYPRMARAHGYVDGYMRALLECGLATKDELLRMVAEERSRIDGPATRYVQYGEVNEVPA